MRRCLLPLAVIGLLSPTPTLSAQTTTAFSPFVAVDQSLPGDPLLLGLSAAVYRGSFGLRASAAAAAPEWQVGGVDPALDAGADLFAYAADIDVVVQGPRRAGAAGSLGRADPRLFGGIGLRGDRFADRELELHAVASFGTTISYSLHRRLRAEVEARRVIPLEKVADLIDGTGALSGGAWEFRAGFSLNFGRGALVPRPGIIRSLPIPGASGPTAGTTDDADGPRVVGVAAGTVLGTAHDHLGTPYVWGGANPSTGFDCSGFVQYVFARHDVRLPRPSRVMAEVGEPVRSMDRLAPGDLVFFDGNQNGVVDHVALYAGSNNIIHASSSGTAVSYDDLTTPRGQWFQSRFVIGRRVLGNEIDGVTVHGFMPGVAAAPVNRPQTGRPAPGIAAFLEAAGVSADALPELAAMVQGLFDSDEVIDPPDRAPARRW